MGMVVAKNADGASGRRTIVNMIEGHKIGFVGLGNMGRANVRHLHAAGAKVVVWNRSEGPAKAAAAAGMERASSLPELARAVGSGVICVNLTTTEVVRDVVFGAGGLAEGLDRDALIVDLGTTGVPETREFAARVHWVDAPVSGGQVGAEAATLTIMAGGSAEDFARARPFLEVLGKSVTHMGPSGAGQVTKLANQLVVAQTIDAVAQALRMAELAGVDPGLVRQALLGGFAQSRILDLHGERMIRRQFAPGGRASNQLKDVRLVAALAKSVGFSSPALDVCVAQWEKMAGRPGWGDLDHSALFKLYEPQAPAEGGS
jgi:3-hydroxyisobutyrate dehydrogenase-like beta-hydroxyacid dehydrogenase